MSSVVAVVKSIIGQVIAVSPEGVQRVLVEGDRIYQGEQLLTGAAGAVTLDVGKGKLVDLGRDSQWSSADLPQAETHHAAAQPVNAPSAEDLQKAIAAGLDPTQALAPTAAGPSAAPSAAGNGGVGGGHSFVVLDATAGRVDPNIGYTTAGLDNGGSGAGERQSELQPNLAPVFIGDGIDGSNGVLNLTTAEDTQLTGAFSARDPNGDRVSYSVGQAPANGLLVLNPNGTWQYNPNGDYNGADSFTVIVTDARGASSTLVVNVGITPVNDAPVVTGTYTSAITDTAANDSFADIRGQLTATDVDDSNLTWSGSAKGAYGELTVNADGSYTYVVDANAVNALPLGQNPSERFTVTVTDPSGATDTRVITINIQGANDTPVARDGQASGHEDSVIGGQLVATDRDSGSTLAFTTNGHPPAGFILKPDGSWTFDGKDPAYQHLAEGETLVVQVPYTVTDEHGATSTATLTVTLTGTNDAPVAYADGATTEENTALNGQVPTATDVDGTVVGYQLTTDVGPHNGTLTFNPDGSYSFNPGKDFDSLAQGETRDVTFTYQAKDNNGALSDPQTITLTITGSNDAPVASATSDAVKEDAQIGGQLAATDADHGAKLSYALDHTAPAGFSVDADGKWSFDASVSEYQHLKAGATQTLSIPFTVTDEHGATSSSSLTLTITGTNDAPVAHAASANASEDKFSFGKLTASDVDDGAKLSFSLNGKAPAGFALGKDGSWIFNGLDPAYQSLAAGETKVLSIDYSVTDEHGASSTNTLTLTVSGTNDTPLALPSLTFVREDAQISGELKAIDLDNGAQLTYSLNKAAPAGLTLGSDGQWSFDAGVAAYQHLKAGAVQVISVPYSVTDEHGASTQSVLVITVTGTNDAPKANAATAAAAEDAVSKGQLTASDVDDGAKLSFSVSGNPPAGFTLKSDGSWTFDGKDAAYQSLAEGETQDIQVKYIVTDEHGATDTQTLTITVTGSNDAALIGGQTSADVDETDTAVNTGGQLTISDVDGPASFQPQTDTLGQYGKFSIDASGQWTYYAQGAYNELKVGEVLTDTFAVKAADGTTANVTVNIVGTNDAPFAIPASANAVEGGVNQPGLVDNATEGSAITLTVTTTHAGEAVSFNWNFSTQDYGQFNDFAYVLINGQVVKLSDVATVGDGGSSGQQTFSHVFGQPGTYTIVVGVADYGDKNVDSSLVLSNLSSQIVASHSVGSVNLSNGSWTLTSNGATQQTLQELNKTGALVGGQLQASDVDHDAQLTFSLKNAAPAGFVLHGDGTWSFDPTSPAYDSLAAGEQKVLTIDYVVTDEHNATSSSTLTLTVTGTNDAPVATAAQSTVHEDQTASGTIGATDVDHNSTLSYAAMDNLPAGVTLRGDGSWTFNGNDSAYQHLAEGETQTQQIAYKVTDEHGATSYGTLTLNVVGANDAAILGSADVTLQETNAVLSTGGQLSISDVDSPATFQPQTGTSGLYGQFSIDAAGNWTYTANSALDNLAAGQKVQDTFVVKSADGTETSVKVTIVGTNDAALIGSTSVTLQETDAPLTAGGQLSISDVDSPATFQAQSDTVGKLGNFSIDSAGNWNFVANSAFDHLAQGKSLSEVFEVKSADGTLGSVTITINGSNDAPIASNSETQVAEDVASQGQLGATDADDGAQLQYALIGNAPAGFVLQADGHWTFDGSDPAYQGLKAGEKLDIVVKYSVSDEHNASDDGMLKLVVTGANDGPTAVADSANAQEDTTLKIDVLGNDTDPDGDSLVVTAASAANGSVAINQDGTLSYTPKANYSGTDTITYSISDGHGGTSSATVNVTIEAVADKPELSLDSSTSHPTATGLTVDTWTGLALGNGGNGALPADLQAKIDAAGTPATHGSTDSVRNTDVTAGTATKVSGLIFLEAGHTYTFSGVGDDSVRLVVGGSTVAEATWGGSSGQFSGTFTPTESGYYPIALYQHNQSGPGNYTLNLADNGGTAQVLGTGSALVYHDSDELAAGGERLSDLGGSAGQSHYKVFGRNEGNEDTAINLSKIKAALVDTDGSETLSVSIGKIPAGATLSDGKNSFTADATHHSVDLTGWNLDTLTLTPPENFNGTLKLEVSATATESSNGDAATRSADLNVTVYAVNDAPTVSGAQNLSTDEDTPVNGQIHALDVDGDSLTYAVKDGSGPNNGLVSFGSDGHYTYTPGANYNGSDNFTVVVSDGQGGSVEQVVTVSIAAVNDAPEAKNDQQSTGENASLSRAVPTATDIDSAINPNGYALVKDVGSGNGTLTFNANGSYVFNPGSDFDSLAAGESRQVTFTYTAKDAQGAVSAPATVTITVNGANDAPTGADKTIVIDEDSSRSFTASDFGFQDVDHNDALSAVRIDSLPTHGTLKLNGSAVTAGQVIDAADLGKLVFTPAANANGDNYANFTFSVKDSNNAFDATPNKITVNVTPVNDAPLAVNDTYSLSGLKGSYWGYREGPDGSNLTSLSQVVAFITGKAAAATFTASNLDYNLNGGDLGGDGNLQKFLGSTDAATLNTDPANTSDAIIQLTGAISLSAGNYQMRVNADDGFSIRIDGVEVFKYDAIQSPTGRESAVFNIAQGGSHTLEIVYWDQGGQAQLKVELKPQGGDYAVIGGTQLTHPVGELVTNEDTPLTIAPQTLLGNDSDVDGDSLTIISVQGAQNGTVKLENGNVIFTPAKDYNGSGSFTYTVSDGHGGTDTATVTVGINAVNDAPTLVADTASTHENTAVKIDVLSNDSDVDGDKLAVSAASATNGSVLINTDGTLTYTPKANFNGNDTISYTVSDGHGGTATSTVAVSVVPVADAPLLVSGNIFVLNPGAVTISTTQAVSQSVLEQETGLASGTLDKFNPPSGPITNNANVNVIDGALTSADYSLTTGSKINFTYSFTNGETSADEISRGYNDIVALVVTDPTGAKQIIQVNSSEQLGANVSEVDKVLSFTADKTGNYHFDWLVLNGGDADKDSSLLISNTSVTFNGKNYGSAVDIALTTGLVDTDGSETLSVKISGVPNDAAFTAGTKGADGSWTFTEAQLHDLQLLTAVNYTGTLNLNVTATATESDGSTASSNGTLTVTIDKTTSTSVSVGNDLIHGLDGNDNINASSGHDIVYGGTGNDTLSGGDGNDSLYGGLGNDTLNGNAGNDLLVGNEGNDILNGGDGNDILIGGKGNDTLTGGVGADTFTWRAGDTGSDTITDFKISDGDRIDLSDLLPDAAHNDILSYLKVDTATSTLQVSTTGHVATSADVTIKLSGVDLATTYGTTNSSEIVNKLVAGADPVVKTEHH